MVIHRYWAYAYSAIMAASIYGIYDAGTFLKIW